MKKVTRFFGFNKMTRALFGICLYCLIYFDPHIDGSGKTACFSFIVNTEGKLWLMVFILSRVDLFFIGIPHKTTPSTEYINDLLLEFQPVVTFESET